MQYQIKGFRDPDGLVSLSFEAATEADAVSQAESQGYQILTVRSQRSWGSLTSRRGGKFPLVLFSQELLALLSAGLTLVEAMEALAEKEQQTNNKHVLDELIRHLYQGRTLSQTLQQFPKYFPPLYIATVRASERTGDLNDALSRYVVYQLQLDFVRKKLVSASIYPMLLMLVGGLVTLFLMTYVVPKFSHIFEDMGGDLPLMSRLLLQWGHLLEDSGPMVMGGVLAFIGLVIYLSTQTFFKRWVGDKLWQLPGIGERMRLYQLARFYRTLGMLLRGGTPVVNALEMASGLLHPTIRKYLEPATRAIREGRSISDAMEEYRLTTPVSLRLLRVGERTGNMGEMMDRVASFYDDEIARWVDWFTKLFEPLLMVFIGLIIGAIVVLMYMPVFELAGSIQ